MNIRTAKLPTAKQALPWLNEWVPAFLTGYQRGGILHALRLPGQNCHFWWSCGSGKTLGAIVWLLSVGPSVTIVVTKAGARGTWEREVESYTRGIHCETLEGEGSTELVGKLPADRPVVFLVAYEILPGWIDALVSLRPTSVVFDEIHKVKSHRRWNAEVDTQSSRGVKFSLKANRSAACYRLSRIARRRLGTTATPITDRVRDLWAQLDLVHPRAWGSYWEFARRYCNAHENLHGGMDDRGASNLTELKERLALVSHRVRYSQANRDLPPKRRLVTYIRVADQCRAEGGIAAELRAAARHGPTALLEARLMESASRKRKVVLDRASDALESGQKVCIFTGRRVDCERLYSDARALKLAHPFEVFSGHGGDSTRARDQVRESYMHSPGPALLVGTIDAFGESVDLQDTDLGILAMLPYTPAQIMQAEGRWARLGQRRPVLIWFPICEGSIDEHVATILLAKLPAVEKATDSDEITGLGRELVGASEEELLASLVSKVIGEI